MSRSFFFVLAILVAAAGAGFWVLSNPKKELRGQKTIYLEKDLADAGVIMEVNGKPILGSDVEFEYQVFSRKQEILDQHDGIVNVMDTSDGNVMISLEGGCTGCSSTPMTAMQIYYALMKLNEVNDVVFVNGELPEYMRTFIDDKLKSEE